MSEKADRFIVSLKPEAEGLVAHIQSRIQEAMPAHLKSMKVSKALAVETALSHYVKHLESTDEQF